MNVDNHHSKELRKAADASHFTYQTLFSWIAEVAHYLVLGTIIKRQQTRRTYFAVKCLLTPSLVDVGSES